MMNPLDFRHEAVKQLSRAEHIREETKRALEFGQVPKTPTSIRKNFRVDGLVPVVLNRACDAQPAAGQTVQRVISRSANSFLPSENPKYLRAAIEAELDRMTPANRSKASAKLLALATELIAAAPNDDKSIRLHRRVMIEAFGEEYLQSEQSPCEGRGPKGRSGSAGPEGKGN